MHIPRLNLHRSQLIISITLAIALTIAGLKLIPHYIPTPQAPIVAEVNSVAGTISLELSASKSLLNFQQPNNLTLQINSTGHATGIEAELTFDPNKLEVISVTQGDFFANTLSPAKIEDGTITFVYIAPPNSGGITGSGLLATLSVKPRVPGPINIEFTDNTVASATEATDNTLGSIGIQDIASYIPGDFNHDNTVNIYDFNKLVADFGNPYTIYDFNRLVANFGYSYPPAAIVFQYCTLDSDCPANYSCQTSSFSPGINCTNGICPTSDTFNRKMCTPN